MIWQTVRKGRTQSMKSKAVIAMTVQLQYLMLQFFLS